MADTNVTTTTHCDAHQFTVGTCRACAEAFVCRHGVPAAGVITRATYYLPDNQCGQCATEREAARVAYEARRAEWQRTERERAEAEALVRAEIERARANMLRGDEKGMAARFSSICPVCDRPIIAGEFIAYSRSARSARHINCTGAPRRIRNLCIECGEDRWGAAGQGGDFLCDSCAR